MSTLNHLLGGLFDGLLYPFRGLPPLASLSAVSLLTALGMLLVFKATSNQKRIAEVKRRIHAGLFEIRLFNDDLTSIFRAQTEILRHDLTYLRLSLVPMLWMIVPVVLVLAQLQSYYGYRALQPGDRALFKVELRDGWERNAAPGTLEGVARPAVDLETPAGLRAETPAVWIPSLQELAWRIAADHRGEFEVEVKIAGESYTKKVLVSKALLRRSPVRQLSGLRNQLLHPAEDPLPKSSPIRSITVTYADADVGVFGWRLHWLVVFFALSIVFALALRGRFKVTI